MENVTKTVIDCIKYEICRQNEKIVLPEISARFLAAMYQLSKAHDMTHLVGDALSKCGVFTNLPDTVEENDRATIEKIKAKLDEQVFTAVYRYENINYELEQLKQAFNEEKIPFIPLKGSVIRRYYPEPWMRTSCDIDILVKEENLDKAVKVLTEKKGFKQEGKRNFHDISLYSSAGIHLELHFNIKETVEKLDAVLKTAWEHAVKKDDDENKYEYRFSEEFFLFHLYAHASYHFVQGGCGVRPFLDLYLLNKKIKYDREKLNALLEEAGIKKFAEEVEHLAETWFGELEYTNLTRRMEEYILNGGVYGTLENRVAVEQGKQGKFGYVLSRIWLPYKSLKCLYPSLEKHKWLLPFYEIRRWFALLFNGGVKRGSNELKVKANLSDEKKQAAKNLIDELGL